MKIIASIVCLLCVPTEVWSQKNSEEASSGWYVGAGAGQGEMEVIGHDRSEIVAKQLAALGVDTSQTSGGEEDGTDTYRIVLGYRLDPTWAVEASWQDLGNTDGSFQAQVSDSPTITGRIESEYQSAALSLLARYPAYQNFSWIGEVGVHSWQQKFTLHGSDGINNYHHSDKDNDTDYFYGVGVDYDFDDAINLRLEWQRFNGIEDEEGADVKSLTLFYYW